MAWLALLLGILIGLAVGIGLAARAFRPRSW